MNEKIFNWYQLIIVSVVVAIITAVVTADLLGKKEEGKFAIVDEEAIIADYVLSQAEFTEDHRKHAISSMEAVRKKYTDQGYVIFRKEACNPTTGATVITAMPSKPLDLNDELREAISNKNKP